MNNYIPNNYLGYYPNMELIQKLSMQGGNNMNFNKCDYMGSNNLYDVYNGFIRGNMFSDLYNQYKIAKPFEIEPINKQAEMLTYIDAYDFACHDLNLYLDTHPTDSEMINLFNEYTNHKNQITRDYENNYGPLFVSASKNSPWSWNESPWPWER